MDKVRVLLTAIKKGEARKLSQCRCTCNDSTDLGIRCPVLITMGRELSRRAWVPQ